MNTPTLKQRNELHLARKIWHMGMVSLMWVIYLAAGPKLSFYILLGAALILLPIDLIRPKFPELNRLVIRMMGPVMRQSESNAASGVTYLIIGTCVLLLFPPSIVKLVLLFLAFGDPIASFFGVKFGKDKILGNKTLQGTMAAFVTCTVISGIYYYAQNIMTERLFIVAPLSGVIGAFAELVPVAKLDDNFTIPVMSAVLLWGLFHLFGGFPV